MNAALASRQSLWAGVVTILRKDLLIEWRTRARATALIFFSFASLLLFSFAIGADPKPLLKGAGGFLWLALLFSSILSLAESFRVESENSALEGLRLLPADPYGIFIGKALGNALILSGIGIVLVPIAIALFDAHLALGFPRLAGVIVLGSLAIAAPGTLYAAIAAHARARDVLLPVLLFPLLVPALVSVAKATALILLGDPMMEIGSWLLLLSLFGIIYWALGTILFPRVIEE
jgi:heme exporter protein B